MNYTLCPACRTVYEDSQGGEGRKERKGGRGDRLEGSEGGGGFDLESLANHSKHITKTYGLNGQKMTSLNLQGFDQFWKLYPRKTKKARSVKAWTRKKCDLYLEAILSDLHYRMDETSEYDDLRYVPHPATYLNDERWNDEREESDPFEARRKRMDTECNRIIEQSEGINGTVVEGNGQILPRELAEETREIERFGF